MRGPRHRVQRWLLSRGEQTTAWSTVGGLFLVASVVAAALVVGGAQPAVAHRAIVAGLIASGVLLGAVLLRRRPRTTRAVEPALMLGGCMVGLAVWASDDASSPFAVLFTWVGVEGALLLSARASARLVIFCAGAHALALLSLPTAQADDAGMWVMTVVTMVVLSTLAWALRLRADGLIGSLRETLHHDALTGVLNRRGYQRRIDHELRRAARQGHPLTVVLGDLDHFRALNDRFGHRRGDDALEAFADVLRTFARTDDAVARIGGEEFALVLPGMDVQGGRAVAERLRASVGVRLQELGTPGSASFGVAAHPVHGGTGESLLDAADQALHVAKHLGRNRTAVFTPGAYDEVLAQRALTGSGREQLEAMLLLAATLDLRDPSTARHSQTVGALAEQTACALGLGAPHVARVRLAGLLHDIGKIGVPDAILHKPAALTEAEYAEMQRHASVGAHILESAGLSDIAGWVLCHHERPDGRGYPNGRTTIPLESRILAVADAFEAMTADRVYRAAMPIADAVTELRRCSGSQFDPEVVVAFLAATKTGAQRPRGVPA